MSSADSWNGDTMIQTMEQVPKVGKKYLLATYKIKETGRSIKSLLRTTY